MNKPEPTHEAVHAHPRQSDDSSALRNQLTQVQTRLGALLSLAHHPTPLRSSLSQLLEALAEVLQEMVTKTSDQAKSAEGQDLRLRQLQFKAEMLQQRAKRAQGRCDEQEQLLLQSGTQRRLTEQQLLEESQHLRNQLDSVLFENENLKKELQLRDIVRKEDGRITISAAIHHIQQELQRTRLQCEKEFEVDCESLVAEMRQKDELFRLALRQLHGGRVDEPQEQEDFGRVLAFISDIANIEQLNAALNHSKAETLNLKREARQREAQQQEREKRLRQLQEETGRLRDGLQRQGVELRDCREELLALRGQFQRERQEHRQLQTYFSQKWLKQFEIVRANLERAFSSRLLKIKTEYQAKISTSQLTQVKHQQATQVITSMKGEIATLEEEVAILQEEVRTGQEVIVKLVVEKEQFRQEAVHSHKLVAECQQSAVSRTEEVLREKDKEILQLKHQLSSATSAKESYEQRLGNMKKKMRAEADEERRVLENKLIKERETKAVELEETNSKHQHELVKIKTKEEGIRQQLEIEISQLQAKNRREIGDATRELQEMRGTLMQVRSQSEKRQKTLESELEVSRKAVAKETEKLRREVEDKTSCIRTLQERARHDQTFKKEMRYLLDLKIKDYAQLSRENERVLAELQERENELAQLNNILLNNDWKEVISQLRAQFRADLFALNEIHWKQMQIYRGKVHELEEVLYRRQQQDEQKLISLSHHNEMLETRLELEQRRRTEEGEVPLPLSVSFVESRHNLLLTKRRRRGNFQLSQTFKQRKESSTAAAIIRMKRFLERGKSTDTRQPLSPIRTRYYRQSTDR